MKATDQSNVAAAQGRLTDATRCGSSQQTIENHAAAAPADQAGRRQPEGCPAANAEISSTASGSAALCGPMIEAHVSSVIRASPVVRADVQA